MFIRLVECWTEWIFGIEYDVDILGCNWGIFVKNTGRKEAGGRESSFDEAKAAAQRWVASAHCNSRE
jgi:hypothetical protein